MSTGDLAGVERPSFTDTPLLTRPKVTYQAASGFSDYQLNGKTQKAEWMSCLPLRAKTVVYVMHRDQAGFDHASFCDGWIAQTFLYAGFAVVAANRPGFGLSTGKPDFSGAASIIAVDSGLRAATAQLKPILPLVGGWGYAGGASAAALVSRKLSDSYKSLQWLILGSGVYDLEMTLQSTTDAFEKAGLESVRRAEGNKGLEMRSIAYDVEGFPKRIILYHGKNDTVAPPKQAEALRNALATAEYDVTLQLIEGLSHDFPWPHHRQLLEVYLRSMH